MNKIDFDKIIATRTARNQARFYASTAYAVEGIRRMALSVFYVAFAYLLLGLSAFVAAYLPTAFQKPFISFFGIAAVITTGIQTIKFLNAIELLGQKDKALLDALDKADALLAQEEQEQLLAVFASEDPKKIWYEAEMQRLKGEKTVKATQEEKREVKRQAKFDYMAYENGFNLEVFHKAAKEAESFGIDAKELLDAKTPTEVQKAWNIVRERAKEGYRTKRLKDTASLVKAHELAQKLGLENK